MMFPTPKFVMGTAFYLFGVLLLSWRDMDVKNMGTWQYVALGIGAGSVAMVITTASIVAWGMSKTRQMSGEEALDDALHGVDSGGGGGGGGGGGNGKVATTIVVPVRKSRPGPGSGSGSGSGSGEEQKNGGSYSVM